MVNLQDKKRSAYSAADLAKLDATLADYSGTSRALESETVNDLEKHLWLGNGAAATVAIGFIQTKKIIPLWQYIGAWAFVSGILLLLILKYVSALILSFNGARVSRSLRDLSSRWWE